jgi:hypothetical protein
MRPLIQRRNPALRLDVHDVVPFPRERKRLAVDRQPIRALAARRSPAKSTSSATSTETFVPTGPDDSSFAGAFRVRGMRET